MTARLVRALLGPAAALLPLPVLAAGAVYHCVATERLYCTAQSGCQAQQPDIEDLSFSPVDGKLQFCRFGLCFAGVAELEREGWPEWQVLGLAVVEKLPLASAQRGSALFASFEVNERRFVLSSLGPHYQDITWFDCTQVK